MNTWTLIATKTEAKHRTPKASSAPRSFERMGCPRRTMRFLSDQALDALHPAGRRLLHELGVGEDLEHMGAEGVDVWRRHRQAGSAHLVEDVLVVAELVGVVEQHRGAGGVLDDALLAR